MLFTADALHCKKGRFAQAVATGNALLVRVKDNQASPPCMRSWPSCATGHFSASYETVDRGFRGRQEHRRVERFDTAGLLDAPGQALFGCIARVSRLTYSKGARSGTWATREQVGFHPRQVRHGAKLLGCAIRTHSGVENRAYYVRDVTLGEGASRIRTRHTRPGMIARTHSVVANVLHAKSVQNISLVHHADAVSLDHLLTSTLFSQTEWQSYSHKSLHI